MYEKATQGLMVLYHSVVEMQHVSKAKNPKYLNSCLEYELNIPYTFLSWEDPYAYQI